MVSFGEKGTCREIKKIRLYTEMDKIAEYFRFLIFFLLFFFLFFFFEFIDGSVPRRNNRE